jgi:hypothetical protein
MKKILSGLAVAIAVLTLGRSAMADDSDEIKFYKFKVTSAITGWTPGLSQHAAAFAKLKEEMAKLKPSDAGYKEKKKWPLPFCG